MEFYDVHTHQIFLEDNDDPYHSCIFDVSPLEFEVARESYNRHAFSCGIHPWYTEESETQMAYLNEIAPNPRIIAIGETGLDRLKGPALDLQRFIFKRHIELSERLGKPVIIHCVKAWEELIEVRRETRPTQPWVIHGYRGKPQLTKRLLKEGFLFSIGDNINVESMQLIPITALFCETDKDEMTIREIYQQTAQAINMELELFADRIAENVQRIFPALPAPKRYDPDVVDED